MTWLLIVGYVIMVLVTAYVFLRVYIHSEVDTIDVLFSLFLGLYWPLLFPIMGVVALWGRIEKFIPETGLLRFINDHLRKVAK